MPLLFLSRYRVAAPATYRDLVVSLGPYAYYRLGEATTAGGMIDEMGNATGSYNGSSGSGFTLGQTGLITGDSNKAIITDGSIAFAGNASGSFTNSDFSIVAWIKPSSIGTTQIIVGRDAGGGTEPNRAFHFRIETSGLFSLVLINSGGGASLLASSSTLSAATRYFVCATYDGSTSTTTLYLNGVSDNSASGGVVPAGGSCALGVAGRTGGNNPYIGVSDEVAYWKRVLTSAECLSMYNAGV